MALKYRAQLLTMTLLFFAFTVLTLLSRANPILTPVTDDWLYLIVGSHEISIFRYDTFELINGHQQVLVKVIVWIVGFLPGVYYSYIWTINSMFAFIGFNLLIFSQITDSKSRMSLLRITVFVAILCNFKPLYLYMSFTGTGLCLTLLFFGLYYFAGSKSPHKKYEGVQDACAFLAPFATGFGISLAIAHLIQLLFQNRGVLLFKLSKSVAIRFSITILGLMFAYALPLFYKITNSRSPGDGISKLDNLIWFVFEPVTTIRFVCGLLGSTLVPSSRFEPFLPVTLGALLLALALLTFSRYFTLRSFLRRILFNKTPFIGAVVYILMLVVFRGLGSEEAVDESLAPRFVMGISLFLFSLACIIFGLTETGLRIPSAFLIILMMFSASGIKTGLEWLTVRSQQTVSLHSCLESKPLKLEDCLHLALPIQEGDSSRNTTLGDLTKLSQYLQRTSE